MRNYLQFYINGQWVSPLDNAVFDVINPATELRCGQISLGSVDDVDKAVKAASHAFTSYSMSLKKDRIEILQAIIREYKNRYSDIADAISEEMGAPHHFAIKSQTGAGLSHLKIALNVLQDYQFEHELGNSVVCKEPVGVCALITPWNWPVNQITCKVAPALATGCTMVLKPSEVAPLSAIIFAEVIDKAGLPDGVFNLVNGKGSDVGAALCKHPLVDMVSFTGSTLAGTQVATNAAKTVKRVTQELGGKSANIILEDADLEKAVTHGVRSVFSNTGQSCDAPTRMLVPARKIKQVEEIAMQVAGQVVVGDPCSENTTMGPVANKAQFEKVQRMINEGIKQGAKLVTGGTGRPEELKRGYFVKPTIFSQVTNQMKIAREEIFGPVLSIIPYNNLAEAIQIANDSSYGLAAYIQGKDRKTLQQTSHQLRAGSININNHYGNAETPFGGYKQSGNGREWGEYGFTDYLEIKSIAGLD